MFCSLFLTLLYTPLFCNHQRVLPENQVTSTLATAYLPTSFHRKSYTMTIKLLPINTKGLIHPAKRSSFWKLATTAQCNIIYMFSQQALLPKKDIFLAVKYTVSFQLTLHITDENGRYLICLCKLNDSSYTIVNLYVPNTLQIRFLRKLHRRITTVHQGSIIWSGNFNITPELVSSNPSKWGKPSLGLLLQDFQLYDVCQCQHPEECNLTFFSTCHNSYSHIDLLITDQWLLQKMSASQ